MIGAFESEGRRGNAVVNLVEGPRGGQFLAEYRPVENNLARMRLTNRRS